MKAGLTISVSRTVDVAIVTGVTLVLDMCRVDSDTTGLFLRRLVNLGIVGELGSPLLRQNLGNGCSQCSLAMVDVTCIARR